MTCPHASGRRKRVQKRRSAPARMPACVYAHPHTHTANIFIGGQAGPRNGRGILLETSCGSRGLGKAHGYGKPTTRVTCDLRSENFMVTRIVARGAWTVYVRPCCPPLSLHQLCDAWHRFRCALFVVGNVEEQIWSGQGRREGSRKGAYSFLLRVLQYCLPERAHHTNQPTLQPGSHDRFVPGILGL